MITSRRPKGLIRAIEKAEATPFEKKVWKALLTIPKGEVRSYSWIARRVGSPTAARAVGNALNKNPFAPDVPCHRVVKQDGSLGGYAKGIGRKKALLKKEGYFLK
jgi:O-6-methylguanine DNA methyltransferase